MRDATGPCDWRCRTGVEDGELCQIELIDFADGSYTHASDVHALVWTVLVGVSRIGSGGHYAHRA